MDEVTSGELTASYSFDVFLSYAHENGSFARDLVEWLRQTGYRVWIDEEQLIPGTRFRAGLQQGLRESRHMVAMLTPDYVSRPWTQREIDLFDLDADRSERKMLAIQVGDLPAGGLDQVFLVYQRILWRGEAFDPEAFWHLSCGLANRRPGPRQEWGDNGLRLLDSTYQSSPASEAGRRSNLTAIQDANYPRWDTRAIRLARKVLDGGPSSWEESFGELCDEVSHRPTESVVQDLIGVQWGAGHADLAAVFSLAMLTDKRASWTIYRAWPFVDLSCFAIAGWFLTQYSLTGGGDSEIWLTWAASQKFWDLMPSAAAKAPRRLSDHFEYLALSVSSRDRSFARVEAEYDYGTMITPWNHFHLSWVAECLGDFDSSISHLRVLCETGARGDYRTARFINRLATWPMFSEHRRSDELREHLLMARERLELTPLDKLPLIQERLTEIWDYVMVNYIT